MTFPMRTFIFAGLAATVCAGCALAQPANPPCRHSAPPAPHAAAARMPQGTAALLPVSLTSLRAAAALAARFATGYGTSRPGESPRAWLDRLRPLATAQLAAILARAAPWQAHNPATSRVISEDVRDLAAQAVTFALRVRQQTAQPGGTATTGYAITVIRQPCGGWAVYDIEPASAGNAG